MTRLDSWRAFFDAYGCAFTGRRPDIAATHAEHPFGATWDWPVENYPAAAALVGTRTAYMRSREQQGGC